MGNNMYEKQESTETAEDKLKLLGGLNKKINCVAVSMWMYSISLLVLKKAYVV